MGMALSILAKLGMSLVTEAVAKKIIVLGLEQVAKKTQYDGDDKLLNIIKDAWQVF